MNAENGKLFVISGSSGVGKGTLLKELLAKNPTLKLSISVTTRNPRPNEVDGVNYFFVTREEFETSVKNGEFLEWAEFNGNYYGTKETYVKKTLAKGENLILEIETKGALQIKHSSCIHSTSLFVTIPHCRLDVNIPVYNGS